MLPRRLSRTDIRSLKNHRDSVTKTEQCLWVVESRPRYNHRCLHNPENVNRDATRVVPAHAMASPIRAFIAVPVPHSPGLRRVQRELGDLGGTIRALESDELHLTVKFLGETVWEQTAEVTEIMEEICSGIPAHDAEVIGLGAFPRPSHPMIVWAGLEPADPVCRLATQLNDELSRLGFPREERAFQPHITLARVKGRPPHGLAEYVAAHSQQRFHSVKINEVCLYQSELRRAGPVYTRLATIPLRD